MQHAQTEPQRTDDLRSEVQSFLDRFARALTSGDGKTIATLWETPAFALGDEGPHAIGTPAEIERFFGGAKEQYNQRGIVDTRPQIMFLERVSDRIVVADVCWPYLDREGHEVGAECSTYTLRRDDRGALRLRIALMRGVQRPR